MPQETADAAKFMSIRKPDGTVINRNGVTLPSGRHLTLAEYDEYLAAEQKIVEQIEAEMVEETTRHGKTARDASPSQGLPDAQEAHPS